MNEQRFEFTTVSGGSSRRGFLVWCLMLGVVQPERLVERVVADVAREQPVDGKEDVT